MPSKNSAGVIAPPPLIFAVCLLMGYGLQTLYPVICADCIDAGIIHFIGWLTIAMAVGLAVWAVVTMRRAGTSESPFNETTALVTAGPYKHTRNPMYISLTLLYLGIAQLNQWVWPLATLPLAIVILHYGVILREEKYLEGLFAEEYTKYRAKVRRWI